MWLYSYNGKKTGPVSFEEIVNLINTEVIRFETVVCEVGEKTYRAGQHPKLVPYFQQKSQTEQTKSETPPSKPLWLYSCNGKKAGPVSFEEIVNLINAEVIRFETVVCEVGQKPCHARQNQKLIEYLLPDCSGKFVKSQWIYANNGNRVGPVLFEEIVNLINAEVIVPETVVCEVGQKPYQAGQHPKLVPYFQNMKPSQIVEQDDNTNFNSARPFVRDNSKSNATSKKSTFKNKKGLIAIGGGIGLLIIVGFIAICGFMYSSVENTYNEAVKYRDGDGVPKDTAKAVELFREAAQYGHPQAQCELGNCYMRSIGVEKDVIEAAKWYRKSAEQGNAEAQASLGGCYYWGFGVEQNYTESLKWYHKSAEQGNDMAEAFLGACYLEGTIVDKDEVQAVRWYLKSAQHGNSYSQYKLGKCYMGGIGVEKNESEAVNWYRKSAEQGNENAKFELAYILAEQGDSKAQYELANYYADGIGVKQDIVMGILWLRKSAENGYDKAQCWFGECCYIGLGVPQSQVEAIKWFRKSAEQGNDKAKYHLGVCYVIGEYISMDKNEGYKLINEAAKKGIEEAVQFLKKHPNDN